MQEFYLNKIGTFEVLTAAKFHGVSFCGMTLCHLVGWYASHDCLSLDESVHTCIPYSTASWHRRPQYEANFLATNVVLKSNNDKLQLYNYKCFVYLQKPHFLKVMHMTSEAAPAHDMWKHQSSVGTAGTEYHKLWETFWSEQEVTLIKACIQFSVGAQEPKQRSSNATASLRSVHLAPTKLVPERGHSHRHFMSCHIITCATEGQVEPAAQKAVALLWHFSNSSPHSVCTGPLCNQKTKIWSFIFNSVQKQFSQNVRHEVLRRAHIV